MNVKLRVSELYATGLLIYSEIFSIFSENLQALFCYFDSNLMPTAIQASPAMRYRSIGFFGIPSKPT